MNERCKETVFRGRHMSKCTRQAKVERDGVFYCGQHDPIAVQKRREASYEQARDRSSALVRIAARNAEDMRVGRWLRENDRQQYETILAQARQV